MRDVKSFGEFRKISSIRKDMKKREEKQLLDRAEKRFIFQPVKKMTNDFISENESLEKRTNLNK